MNPPPDRRKERIDRERIERAARIYSSNNDAGQALGIAPGSFGRRCRQLGIETPKARQLRTQREAQQRKALTNQPRAH